MFLSGIETPLVDPLVIFAQEVQCFFSQCAVKQLTAGSMIIGKFRSGFQSERSLIVEFGIMELSFRVRIGDRVLRTGDCGVRFDIGESSGINQAQQMLVGKGIVHPKAYLVIVVAGSSDIIHIHRMHRTVGERVKRFLVCLPPFAAVRVRVEKISRKFASGV